MADYKKSFSISGENQQSSVANERISSLDKNIALRAKGLAGDPLSEGVPELIPTQTEKVISGGHNTNIVLGRDRPAGRASGYGGAGHTQAGTIDIVAGRMGYRARGEINGEKAWCNPSFEKDAARIYLSQKTDVDRNFQLAAGIVGTHDTKSAVAIKADSIRIIGRQGVKIVTRCDPENSQGADIESVKGIDLIAGNDDSDMQPMLKGNNTLDALDVIVTHMDKLSGIVFNFVESQMKMNAALKEHVHQSPFFGIPTTPSVPVFGTGTEILPKNMINVVEGMRAWRQNSNNIKNTYLTKGGSLYINSRYHHLN